MLKESQPILSLCTISLLLIETLAFAARGGTETTDNTSTPVTEEPRHPQLCARLPLPRVMAPTSLLQQQSTSGDRRALGISE